MTKFLRGWWPVLLFSACCFFAAHRIWLVGEDNAVTHGELDRCKTELGEYQHDAIVQMSTAIKAWADAGADPHSEAAREMERLMNSGF